MSSAGELMLNRSSRLIGTTRAGVIVLVLLAGFLGVKAGGEKNRQRLTNVIRETGIEFHHVSGPEIDKKYLFEVKGGGVAFVDYDNDGWADIVIVQGSTIELFRKGGTPKVALFRNKRDGTFQQVTESARLTASGWGMGVAAADFDNDGWVDLYITSFGPNTLYRNNGDGTFTDVTEKAGVGDPRWSSSAAFGDYDLDGDLDLYVVNYVSIDLNNLPEPKCRYRGTPTICGPRDLQGASDSFYRNNGDGTFTEVSRESGASDPDKRYGLGAVWGDVDNDSDPDLYVANDFGPNFLFVNKRNGTFDERGLVSGTALSGDGLEQAGMGVDIADYDNDGLMDIFVTNFANDYSTLYRNTDDLMFEDITGRVGIQPWEWFVVSWGVHLADLNHDGWKDIFHSNGHVYPFLAKLHLSEEYREAPSLFLNSRDGTFRDASSEVGPESDRKIVGRGTAMSDYDNDGDLDFLIANLSGSPQLLKNEAEPAAHWIMFRLRGSKSNRDGIGARVKIRAGGLEQIQEVRRNVSIYSSSDPRAHFGIGEADQLEFVEVTWAGGKVQRFEKVAADRHYLIHEESGLVPEPIAGR